jgi:hypothetical protein
MWEFVPCIDHPAAENLEAIDVRNVGQRQSPIISSEPTDSKRFNQKRSVKIFCRYPIATPHG